LGFGCWCGDIEEGGRFFEAMTAWLRCMFFTFSICAALCAPTMGRAAQVDDSLSERAHQEFKRKQYSAAERDFRELTRRDGSNADAYVLLGQNLLTKRNIPRRLLLTNALQSLRQRAEACHLCADAFWETNSQ
jgi:hypothetical protein